MRRFTSLEEHTLSQARQVMAHGVQSAPLTASEITRMCALLLRVVSTQERLVPSDDPHDVAAQEFAEHHGLPYLAVVDAVAKTDVTNILETDPIYGGSWQRRGGVGAFMMLARKWDRLEQRTQQLGYDVFRAVAEDTRREGVIDDVRDLRRYLMLVEAASITRGACALQTASKDSAKVTEGAANV